MIDSDHMTPAERLEAIFGSPIEPHLRKQMDTDPPCDPTIQMAGGEYFNFEHPEDSCFTINDIAHALSHVCRFGGHVIEYYSVAQHSVSVSRLVPEEHALAGLLHDASEAFLGDVVMPLKRMLPDYRAIEHRVQAAIHRRYGLPEEMHECIKHADRRMLATERRDLMPERPGDAWECIAGVTPLGATIRPMRPAEAKKAFLARWLAITEMRLSVRPLDPS